jgi:aerobic carbon-monoxide dehydrogenase medium subunit
VIPASFDYVRPSSVDEAVQALGSAGEDAKVLAGGQSLIPILRLRLSSPEIVVDLGDIADLRGVRDDDDAIVIGAMTTHDEVMNDRLVAAHAPLLAQASALVGDRQVRHLGTLGGSVAHADPAGDLPAVALTLDAEMVVQGASGVRRVPAAEFFRDYLTTAIEPDEVLTAVRIPKLGSGWGVHYEKFNRVAQAWSVVAVAAAVRRSNGTIAVARIGLANMGSTPVRATGVEQALAGSDATADSIRAAAEHAADGTSPPSDLSGQADYRAHLARVLTRRAVTVAAGS